MVAPARFRLPSTSIARYLRERPELVIDRSYDQATIVGDPLPLAYQAGYAAAPYYAHLRTVVGRYPLGAMIPRYSRALEAGVDPEDIAEGGGLDWAPPPREAVPVLATANRARHTSYRQFAQADEDTTLLPFYPWRTYLLIANNSAVDALIAFDRSSSEDGLLLTASGGFLELTMGTVSEVRAQGVGAIAALTIVEGFSFPSKACQLPCGDTGDETERAARLLTRAPPAPAAAPESAPASAPRGSLFRSVVS